jgi:hypothetical protein
VETFVIRIGTRTEAVADKDRGELRGTIEHVGTGRREPFRDSRELLSFLRTEHSAQPEEAER